MGPLWISATGLLINFFHFQNYMTIYLGLEKTTD